MTLFNFFKKNYQPTKNTFSEADNNRHQETLNGLKQALYGLYPDDTFLRDTDQQIENNEYLKNLMETIADHKKKLDSVPKESLNDNQKIWLLAYEATENRFGLVQTDSEGHMSEDSARQISEDMHLLSGLIPNNEK